MVLLLLLLLLLLTYLGSEAVGGLKRLVGFCFWKAAASVGPKRNALLMKRILQPPINLLLRGFLKKGPRKGGLPGSDCARQTKQASENVWMNLRETKGGKKWAEHQMPAGRSMGPDPLN